MVAVDKYAVILEGEFAQSVDDLSDFADAVMEALIDLGAEDPFVFTDAGGPSFRVELVASGHTQTEALASGVQVISEALTTVGIQTPVLTRPLVLKTWRPPRSVRASL